MIVVEVVCTYIIYFITAEDLGKLIHALTFSSVLCDFLNETYNVP